MNRRDFMGLFGKALAGAVFAPGLANSIDIEKPEIAGVYPVSLRYIVDMDYDHGYQPGMVAELRFSDGMIKRHAVEFGPDFRDEPEAVEACAKPILQEWAAETCREYCGVAA